MSLKAWYDETGIIIDFDACKFQFNIGQSLIDFIECDLSIARNYIKNNKKLIPPNNICELKQLEEEFDYIVGQLTSIHVFLGLAQNKTRNILMSYDVAIKMYSSSNMDSIKRSVDYQDSNTMLQEFIIRYIDDLKQIQHQFYNAISECLLINDLEERAMIKERFKAFYKSYPSIMDIKITYSLSEDLSEIYELDRISEICFLEFRKMIEKGIFIKKCGYCNRFFIPEGRIDTDYCNRVVSGKKKTCRQIGPTTAYQKKQGSNEIWKLFNKEYKKRNAWVRLKKIKQQDFLVWSERVRILRDKALRDEITIMEFQRILKED